MKRFLICLLLVGCAGESKPVKTPDQESKEFVNKIMTTPGGPATANYLVNKDDQLTAFQRANGISEEIAEAAIKEWVTTHNGNFDWNLEEVKAICLRYKR